MKKHVATGLAFTLCTISMAIHAESLVTLYGIIDSGLVYQNLTGNETYNGSRAGLSSCTQTTSRWGMKGTEDLGDGYSLNFVLESSFETNNGALLSGCLLYTSPSPRD